MIDRIVGGCLLFGNCFLLFCFFNEGGWVWGLSYSPIGGMLFIFFLNALLTGTPTGQRFQHFILRMFEKPIIVYVKEQHVIEY